jgi:hypothetical protein
LATGEKINQQGEHPNGYLSYSIDGRMISIVTSDNRVKPHKVNPEDEERIKLHQTMIAYAGTYTLESDKVTHHVDISWNEAWTGTDQVRFYRPSPCCHRTLLWRATYGTRSATTLTARVASRVRGALSAAEVKQTKIKQTSNKQDIVITLVNGR